jgi:uncharacterized protein YcgI (DUF1989 family)
MRKSSAQLINSKVRENQDLPLVNQDLLLVNKNSSLTKHMRKNSAQLINSKGLEKVDTICTKCKESINLDEYKDHFIMHCAEEQKRDNYIENFLKTLG